MWHASAASLPVPGLIGRRQNLEYRGIPPSDRDAGSDEGSAVVAFTFLSLLLTVPHVSFLITVLLSSTFVD
jgi:hypothetical protein